MSPAPPTRLVPDVSATRRKLASDPRESVDRLYAELHEHCAAIRREPDLRKAFMERFEALIPRLRDFAKKVRSTEEFEWLSQVTARLEIACSSILREPRDLRKEIGVPDPSLEYLCPVSDAEVDRYLHDKAYEIGQDRKLKNLYHLYLQLQQDRDRIHQETASSPEEAMQDWYLATVCLAVEVLDGTISFNRQISPELYPLLENVWLEDVKRMKAYHIWLENGCPFEIDGGKGEYFQACQQLWRRALDRKSKANASGPGFGNVQNYLEQMYLFDDGKLHVEDSSVEALIAAKARRLWELQNHCSLADADWETAEDYVRAFYENFIPAATKNDAVAHVASVADAFCAIHREQNSHDIANAFEASLVIHYLPAADLKNHCGPNVCQLM